METKQGRQTGEIIALIVLFLSITLMTVAGFVAREWMPAVASEHGVGVDRVIRYLLITTGVILVIGTLVFVHFLWEYGRGHPTASPKTNPRLERWWSLVPVVIMALISEVGVILIGLPVWEQVYGDVPEDAVIVEANAQQFEWIFRYPGPDGRFGRTDIFLIDRTANPLGLDPNDPAALDDIVVRNLFHLPIDRTAVVRLRSRDVLHSFSVPAFRVKQDVVPGMVVSTHFVPTRIGRFDVACAEICGMGHYRMGGGVVIDSEAGYEEWLAGQAGGQE